MKFYTILLLYLQETAYRIILVAMKFYTILLLYLQETAYRIILVAMKFYTILLLLYLQETVVYLVARKFERTLVG